MPHTSSRFQQDLPFTDGLVEFSAADINAISSTAPVLTRNAVGDYAWTAQASATTYFTIDMMNALMRRSGFFEDTQNTFGSTFGGGLGSTAAGPSGNPGTGIPASAAPQGRPQGYVLPGQPQPTSGMSALQEITPRTALKIKGVKPISIKVIYKVLTGAATSINSTVVQTTFANGQAVATGQTTLLASGLNGMTNASAATPYVTSIALPNASYFQITPLTQLWFELAVVEPASNTFQLYGIEMLCHFNFN